MSENAEPSQELLRRRDVLAWQNWSEYELEELVKAGVLNPVHTRPGSRAYYRKSEIKEKILCGTNGHSGVKGKSHK